ncbi:response regulator transcription factor [Paractinoplanes globisporus]|uniref:Response regulator transcription factor n=1 Tax=Paractinoplanes globisporus TaxID=113565 RepID=A0ABW6W594_9ACTN|nr:response regulator transcription factor [Actinoplanes globisporus]
MRLLVVEDERELAESLRRGLIAEGYSVDVAHDGSAGLEYAMGDDYQAVILDLMLPRMNGFQVCARLRESGVGTPVLVLTAKDGEYDEAEALDTGADDYLTKPFSYVVLLARVRALLRRGGEPRPALLKVGELVVDQTQRRCSRGTTPVALTAKQFSVLACLARRANAVVSKLDILDEVWDAAYDGDPNIVEVYIRALRRSIDVPFGVRSIETVRGEGYRLVGGHA